MSKTVDICKKVVQHRCNQMMQQIIGVVSLLSVVLLWFAVGPVFLLESEVAIGPVPTRAEIAER